MTVSSLLDPQPVTVLIYPSGQTIGSDYLPVAQDPERTETVASVSPVPADALAVLREGQQGRHFRRFGLEQPAGIDVADEDEKRRPAEIEWAGWTWKVLAVEAWTGWVAPAYWQVDAVRLQPIRPEESADD